MRKKDRANLLQIVAKQVVVGTDGEIIDHELNSPFAYLRDLADGIRPMRKGKGGSEPVLYRPTCGSRIASPRHRELLRSTPQDSAALAGLLHSISIQAHWSKAELALVAGRG
jgi:hypothetical protein